MKIRSQLSKYLEFHGFGRNMPKKYGEDDPPSSWPVLLDWTAFKGPSKSCSLGLCTEIIKQLMEAQDLDPMDHFVKEVDLEEEEGDGIDVDELDEEGEDVVESDQSQEEEDPQPGPSKRRKLDNVVETIAKVQQKENEENLALAKQKKNVEDIRKGLANLEEGELPDSS